MFLPVKSTSVNVTPSADVLSCHLGFTQLILREAISTKHIHIHSWHHTITIFSRGQLTYCGGEGRNVAGEAKSQNISVNGYTINFEEGEAARPSPPSCLRTPVQHTLSLFVQQPADSGGY